MNGAIIGGTGFYYAGDLLRTESVETPFGTVDVEIIRHGDSELGFLNRHGKGHSVPPHKVNYKANLKALEMLGIRHVLAGAAVGSCNPDFQNGDLILLTDLIDNTRGRSLTYFDGGESGVKHFDMSDPYCRNLRKRMSETAKDQPPGFKGEGVYCCSEGPRFETAAEVRMIRQWGGDVVGMTNVPEAQLAKELGLCYAAVSVVVNMATGMEQGAVDLEYGDGLIKASMQRLRKLLKDSLIAPLDQDHCGCSNALIPL